MRKYDKSRPGYGKGTGQNPHNAGGGEAPVLRHNMVQIWVWVYGKGWEVQEVYRV